MPDETLIMFGGEVKALEGGKVGGYLVRFGTDKDPDLAGDFFTPETDFGQASTSDAYYQHGLDMKLGARVIGKGDLRKDEVGVWIEAQLELRDEYEQAVYEMAKAGKLGWSSGTLSHLVSREPAGKARRITKWPLGLDASLTPTPAEPRNAAMSIKSFAQISAEGGVPAAKTDEAHLSTPQQEKKKMDEKDILALLEKREQDAEAKRAAAAEQEKKVQEAIDAGVKAALKRGGYAYHKTAKAGDDNDGSAAWWHWIKTGDDRTPEMKGFEVKTAMNEGTGANGEYLVPDGFERTIREKLHARSVMRAAGATTIQTSLKMVEFPKENAAAAAALTAEAGSYSESEPTVDVEQITVYKGTNLIKVSEELLSDQQANLDTYLQNNIVNAQATLENTWFLATASNGSGLPKSATYACSAGETTAAEDAITAAELVDLIYSLGDRYAQQPVMFMNRTTLGYIRGITVSNQFAFLKTPYGEGMRGAGDGGVLTNEFIAGIPVFTSTAMSAIATSGFSLRLITYGDPSHYIILENGGLVISRNPYLYQATGQVGIFSKFRVGGSLPIAESFVHLLSHDD